MIQSLTDQERGYFLVYGQRARRKVAITLNTDVFKEFWDYYGEIMKIRLIEFTNSVCVCVCV